MEHRVTMKWVCSAALFPCDMCVEGERGREAWITSCLCVCWSDILDNPPSPSSFYCLFSSKMKLGFMELIVPLGKDEGEELLSRKEKKILNLFFCFSAFFSFLFLCACFPYFFMCTPELSLSLIAGPTVFPIASIYSCAPIQRGKGMWRPMYEWAPQGLFFSLTNIFV